MAAGTWHEIGSIADAWPEMSSRAIVGFAGGYVALVDALPAAPPAVRVSVDGRSWEVVLLQAPEPIDPPGPDTQYDSVATPTAVATDGTTVVVVGSYYHEPCDWSRLGDTGGGPACPSSPISWTTTDGLSWQSSLPWSDACPPADGSFSQGCAFSAVWAVPDGWEAGMFYVGGEAGQQREVWHSDDGLTWGLRGDLVDEDAAPVAAVSFDGRRLVALPCYGDCTGGTRLWTSDDGRDWTETPAPEGRSAVNDAIAPARPGEPWVLAGGDAAGTTAVWTSDDMRTWDQASLPGASPGLAWQVAATTHGAAGYVAVAWGLADESNPYRASWVSSDGLSWRAVPDAPLVEVLADGPAGIVGLGNADDEGVIYAYALR